MSHKLDLFFTPESRVARQIPYDSFLQHNREMLLQDLRYALRTLARAPGFTAIAVITLALGIGANTAIFSLVHAVILKPLPYRDPSRLITIWDTYLPNFPKLGVSPTEWQLWQQQSDLFEQAAWYRYVPQNLTLSDPAMDSLEVHAGIASDQLFPLLGVAPAQGRTFAAGESNAVVLSHEFWRSRLAGGPPVIGRTLRLNDQAYTVVGVMPAGFQFPDWADLWLAPGPLMGDELTNPVRHSFGLVARLRHGVTIERATDRLQALSARLRAEHPKTSTGWGMQLAGLQQDLTTGVRSPLLVLLGAVTLVLLIACANIANLLLSRASGRLRETAVRTALGAGAGRLARQFLTESLTLAFLGGGLGVAVASAGIEVLSPVRAPLDAPVLAFLLGVTTLTGLICGLAPVLQTLRSDANTVIKAGSLPRGSSAVRSALVVSEFALALILAAGAGLLATSFIRLMQVDPGFNPRGLLSVRLSVPPTRDLVALFHRIEARLKTVPGVELVAATNTLPLTATRANSTRFYVPGSSLIDPNALPAAQIRAVSPSYFAAMQVPLIAGRTFTEQDLNGASVIISQSMARRFWPGQEAVGRKFVTGPWGPNPNYSTIIGVAGDVKEFGLDSDAPMDLYFPSLAPTYLIVRSTGEAASITAAVRREIRAAAPELPITSIRTLEDVAAESARQRRWVAGMLAGFAGLALLLAMVGIYGVISWLVAQRTREIGIRMALGARGSQVLAMVVGYAMKLCTAGLAIGLLAAQALRRLVAGLVFGVNTGDPWIYASVALLMLAVAAVASYTPARRASRIDPLRALRWE